MGYWFLLSCGLLYLFLVFVMRVSDYLWWRPKRIEVHFSKQGIKGPKYHFFLGNTKELVDLMVKSASQTLPLFHHNILPRVLPFYHHWKKIYGETFIVWFGPTARLVVSDPLLIREVFISKSESFEKTESPPHVKKLEGDGLLTLEGEKWAHHRKILTPSFYIDNLKLMVPIMGESMKNMLNKWVDISKCDTMEIEVSHWFQNLTEEIITHAVFGSSYEQGKAIFELHSQKMIHYFASYDKVFIPGYRFFPTKKNRQSWKLDREIENSSTKLINERIKAYTTEGSMALDECPKDLLGFMIRDSIKNETKKTSTWDFTTHDIIEECKTLFFAGKHTTSALMTWTTVLLAMHSKWQELARDEVVREFGAGNVPTKDDVAKLKTLNMILNESLRLYPPVVALLRRAKCDVELGGCKIPLGTELLMPILAVHHDPETWGPDATEFNPGRFTQGVAQAAKNPMAFMPFGLGARRCTGQNLAMLQTKLAIAMILQRFSFVLAPSYQHAPTVVMLLNPQYGAPIVFQRLDKRSSNDQDI
uniref:CYP734A51 n=1 Tax=Primula veris TaxID=170927 RepID=A0A1B2LPI0_PRIVE|nr:CYP734A51 [Primula veris]